MFLSYVFHDSTIKIACATVNIANLGPVWLLFAGSTCATFGQLSTLCTEVGPSSGPYNWLIVVPGCAVGRVFDFNICSFSLVPVHDDRIGMPTGHQSVGGLVAKTSTLKANVYPCY